MSNPFSILQQGENEQVEFRTSFSKAVIETLVAFANTKGGTVCVGVKDNGELIGVEIGKETIPIWLKDYPETSIQFYDLKYLFKMNLYTQKKGIKKKLLFF